MTFAFGFLSPWLLLGLAAAAIPVVLHLLASVRAPQVFFPTLRFLRTSMEKTARRRRVEHWLLLLIRSALLAILALAVAEPIMKSTAGFWADRRFAAVLIVDNSYSMGVRSEGASRFDHARREAVKLLGGDSKPTAAALMLTNPAGLPPDLARRGPATLRSDLEVPRRRLSSARLASGRAAIAERVREAVALLADQSAPQKAIYIFSDLQRISFQHLPNLPEFQKADIPLMLVDCSDAAPMNVGVEDLKISGSRIIGQELKFTAALVNSSPTDKVVHAWLQVDGRPSGEPVRTVLQGAGRDGARTTVEFSHRFTAAGVHVGQVAVSEADDLGIDNVRRFSLEIGGKVRALLVRPDRRPDGGGVYDPAMMLEMALDPHTGSAGTWPIRLRTLRADRFDEKSLAGVRAAFFADVPAFTAAQGDVIVKFVRGGGSAVFFLGPAAKAENYNERFAGMLPGRIGKAVGQVGLYADAVLAVRNLRHPYLAGLYETDAEYPQVVVQRYYRLAVGVGGCETVLSAPGLPRRRLGKPGGEPIISAKDFGAGRVVLATTTAGAEWNNLPTTALFLPMVTRICLAAPRPGAAKSGEGAGGDNTFLAGSVVKIRPGVELTDKAAVNVTAPDKTVEVLPLKAAPDGPVAVFTRTDQVGIYRWKVVAAGPSGRADRPEGAFAVNADGAESDLAGVAPETLVAAVRQADRPADIYVGRTLEDLHAAAAEAAAGDNLWDRLLAVAILLLVVEAVAANRFRRGARPTPAHLNPALAA